MWQVTDRFLAALRGSHKLVTEVDVLDNGVAVAGPIPVVSGSVTRDRRAAQLGRMSCVVASEDLAPLRGTDVLSPSGFELAVRRGIEYGDGTTELIPLGVFPVQSATVNGADMTTSIEAVDRSQRVADALMEIDYQYGADTALVIVALVLAGIPDAEFIAGFDFEDQGVSLYESGSDRWAIIQDICRSQGAYAMFNGLGQFVAEGEPDIASDPSVWTIDEGTGGVLVSADIMWSRQPSHNRAIVTGTNTEFDVTYRGVATDDSPSSPSYYYGRFGPKPIFHHSPHVTSNTGAKAAARGILRAKRGVAKSLDLSAVPNVALEPGDVVTVVRERLNLDTPVVLDSITVGLGPEDAMTCSVRARQEDDITEEP